MEVLPTQTNLRNYSIQHGLNMKLLFTIQKQPPEVFYKKPATLFKKETLEQVFSCEFLRNF